MYGKMYRQMYHGTLATTGPWQALVTFQQFIVLADKDGIVDMTPESISRETTIPLEIIRAGIAALELADPDSRTPDEDGRRIVRLNETRSWGWRIVNYAHYRNLRTEEDRREYHRQYWHKRKLNKTQPTQTDSSHSTHAEANAEANAKTRRKVPSEPLSGKPDAGEPIRRVFEHWQDVHRKPRARLDEKRKRVIRQALANYSEADLCQSISGYLNSPHHMGRNDRDTVYNDIGLLLRDSQHIDAGLQFYASPPRANLSKQTRDIIDNTTGWKPPEARVNGRE